MQDEDAIHRGLETQRRNLQDALNVVMEEPRPGGLRKTTDDDRASTTSWLLLAAQGGILGFCVTRLANNSCYMCCGFPLSVWEPRNHNYTWAGLANLADDHWTLSRTEGTELEVFPLALSKTWHIEWRHLRDWMQKQAHLSFACRWDCEGAEGGGGTTKKSVVFGEINELHGLDPPGDHQRAFTHFVSYEL